MPGPGTYNVIGAPGKDSPKFSMRTRTADASGQTTARIVPGPGNYPIVPCISPKGNFMFSKYRNSAATLFNPRCSTRFKEKGMQLLINLSKIIVNATLGPGTYTLPPSININGSYFNSKFKSSGVIRFLKCMRGQELKPSSYSIAKIRYIKCNIFD